MFLNKKRFGFTLIELMLVMAVIGILAVVFVPILLSSPAKARDSQRIIAVKRINDFVLKNHAFNAFENINESGCVFPEGGNMLSDDINNNLSDFGGVFPVDPKNTNPISGSCDASGHFGYVYFENSSSKFSTGVYASVEYIENSNIMCDAIDSADLDISTKMGILADSSDNACYIILNE